MSEQRQPLLIVEDDPALQKQMRWAFDRYETVVASDRESAMAQLRRYEPAVVTMDLGLPPSPDDVTEGMQLLQDVLAAAPDTKVIMLTGQHDRSHALKCVSLGAYDFLEKPFQPELLNLIVERAFRLHELQQENRRLAEATVALGPSGIITGDPEMQRIMRSIDRAATTSATVLILGESGTGKELLARALHERSTRKRGKFVAINCAAIPENLLESELFGYERGAFTGAVKQTLGKIETANGGTLFLDEIGDLPMSLQAKLLRFLQERVIERLGGRQEIPVDVRVVCATHQNLQELIQAGKFREDLYYRLAEIVMTVPPLRQRHGDPSLLAYAFVRRFVDEHKRGSMSLSPEAIDAIEAHAWPGNVRELENCIKRAVIMAETRTLRPEDLNLNTVARQSDAFNLRRVREEAEKVAIVGALGRANNNVSKAAEMLGVSRPTLYDMMERYGLRSRAPDSTEADPDGKAA